MKILHLIAAPAGISSFKFIRFGKSERIGAASLLVLCLFAIASLSAQSARPVNSVPQSLLARHYQDGEKIAYTISSLNESRGKSNEYEARAVGVVGKDPSGVYAETFAWTDLQLNDAQVRLSPGSLAFREPLSLAPGSRLAISSLNRVQPGLIEPITDLLTFYADVKIAMNQKLARAGDHAYVKFSTPSSWADGTKIMLGEDSIDFDVTLRSIDPATQTATLLVRHVPPAQPQIKLPAAWMADRAGTLPNNWVQVEKAADGKFTAGVGQETFNVEIKLSLGTGRILSATMDNPIQVIERVCSDAALANCGSPERYTIHRGITLRSDQTAAQGAQR